MKSFNSSPVVPTPSLGDYSNNVVTSKWVKDAVVAPIYLSPTGDDVNNDGLSSDSPVRSFSRALEIAKELGQPTAKFVVEQGSYTEDIVFMNYNVEIYAQGTITINGNIFLYRMAEVLLLHDDESSATKMFVVNGKIKLHDFSSLYCLTGLTVNSVGEPVNIAVDYHSQFIFYSEYDLTFGYTNTKPSYSMTISYNSFFLGKNVKSINVASTACIYTSSQSNTILCGTNQLERNEAYGYILDIYNGSKVTLTEASTNTFKLSGNSGIIINASNYSSFTATNIHSLTMDHPSTTTGTGVSCASNSFISFTSGTVTMQGSYSQSFDVYSGGVVVFTTNTTMSSGSGCTGKRYTISTGGLIYSQWQGANLIPGSIDGTTSNDGKYY